ncbi:hypothetical protein ASPCAL14344 [Aspergillus calidoustus]|uniref:Uncharacterized protein n=1 Tax=Aspergillus calidoustus TaxID=454130 RepID=A0A0U5CJS8_ASPCI|nr:hypothetical protein ASPCAL14344 [Aspergillus calidoustus]
MALLLYYNACHKALIYRPCEEAVPYILVNRHLRDKHGVTDAAQRQHEIQDSLPPTASPLAVHDDFHPLPHFTPIIPELGTPQRGWYYSVCYFLAIQERVFREHVQRAHATTRTPAPDTEVLVQSWF